MFSTQFTTLATVVVAALATQVAAGPAPVSGRRSPGLPITEAVPRFPKKTDHITIFIGKPISRSSPAPRAAQDVMVTWCTKRTQNVCGGSCTVYNGPPTCLSTPGAACLTASANVGFCDRGGCGGSCNQFSSCGTRLDNNFCSTPGTASVIVPSA